MTIRIPIGDRDEALERYRTDPVFHNVVDVAARCSEYSRSQILAGEAGGIIAVERELLMYS